MPTALDFPARGRILRIEEGLVVFNPADTTYELHLANAGGGAMPSPSAHTVSGYVRAVARKVWTMRSGGNMLTPIFGTPRVVQGRVRYLEEGLAVVQAGCPVLVTIPSDGIHLDLISGPIVVAGMINATVMPGATFELAKTPAAAV